MLKQDEIYKKSRCMHATNMLFILISSYTLATHALDNQAQQSEKLPMCELACMHLGSFKQAALAALEHKQQHSQPPTQESEVIVRLCDLGPICTTNKPNDPLIQEYAQRTTSKKSYTKYDCCGLYAYVRKQRSTPSLPAGTATRSSGSADSTTHDGIVSASYFFSSQLFVCSASLRDSSGRIMPPRCLDPVAFDVLYRLFQEQEPQRKAQQEAEQKKLLQHQEIERKLNQLAEQRNKKHHIKVHFAPDM